MIVWGGSNGGFYFNTGGRYNPSSDSWTATTTTNAPAPRDSHTAIWTGSEMIVWGGSNGFFLFTNGGGHTHRRNSSTATTTTTAPAPPHDYPATRTSCEIIVCGGFNGNSVVFNTGGRYNPSSDSWTATTTTNVPTGRAVHNAIWTGTQMIVWGGEDNLPNYFNTGGKYCAQSQPPVITSPPTATAIENQLFVYQVIATGSPTSYTATPLPAGLTFDSNSGILGGVPASSGTTQIQLTASNSFGTGTATLTLTVQPAPSSGPVVMSGTSITARTGVSFSFEVFTTGGSSTARLSATGLPPGLSVDPVTGIISGTPTADGSFGVT